MFWKENHVTDKYKNGEFLQKKFRETVENGDLLPWKKNRGVNTSNLNDILAKIGPLIPGECLKLWKEIPTINISKDLTVNYDHLEREKIGLKRSMDEIVDPPQRVSARKQC